MYTLLVSGSHPPSKLLAFSVNNDDFQQHLVAIHRSNTWFSPSKMVIFSNSLIFPTKNCDFQHFHGILYRRTTSPWRPAPTTAGGLAAAWSNVSWCASKVFTDTWRRTHGILTEKPGGFWSIHQSSPYQFRVDKLINGWLWVTNQWFKMVD